MSFDFMKVTIARMACVPEVCIRCGANLALDEEEYEKCPSLGCLCKDGPLDAQTALDNLDFLTWALREMVDNEVGDPDVGLTADAYIARLRARWENERTP